MSQSQTSKKYLAAFITAAMLLQVNVTDAQGGGAWTREQGKFYLKTSIFTLRSNIYATLQGEEIESAEFHLFGALFYGEYGLTNMLTTTVNFPVLKSLGFNTTETKTGIGDLAIDFKYQVVSGEFPVAVGLGIELPTGDEKGFGFVNGSNQKSYLVLPTGDGETNVWLRAFASHSFYPVAAYLSVDAGYNFRTRNFDSKFTNQVEFSAEGGYKIADAVWVRAALRSLAPARPPNPTAGASFLYGEGVQSFSATLGAACEMVPRVSISAEVSQPFGALRNLYRGTTLAIGLSLEN